MIFVKSYVDFVFDIGEREANGPERGNLEEETK
jgi:hypothetical protein